MPATLDHMKYYRLPWNYADNGISWLEPTTRCNLRCEGCYRDLDSPKDKTIDEIRSDLEVFKRLRKSDCMSIAGGDPLVYPHIVQLIRMIKEMGWKPIINTNGIALSEPLLKQLKEAGAFGFTFHIDTSQKRPKVTATTETELNDVRLHYAEMLARAGGLACSFNSTVTEKTLSEVPNLVTWAQKHADIVQTMVFILYRSPNLTGEFDYYANGEKVEIDGTYEETEWGGKTIINTADVVEKIIEADPDYEPAAYLNGTANPSSLKWLLANRTVFAGKTMGYMSPKFMELIQTFSHLFTGTYLSYAKPRTTALGKTSSFFGSAIDKNMRRILGNLVREIGNHPSSLLRPAYMQSIMVIQPITFEDDGRQDMCDSCPDITVHEGKLVWSCRLEEMNQYGTFLHSAPKDVPQ